MKWILPVSSVLFAFAAHAETPVSCGDLETLYESAQTREFKAKHNDHAEDIRTAYETLCANTHSRGANVYYDDGQLAAELYGTEEATLYYPNGALMVFGAEADGTTWYYPNGDVAFENPDVLQDILGGFQRKVAPIEAPFKAQHAQCAPGCSYVSWGIWGDEAHKKRKSCHNSGTAIDIHAIKCSGTTSGPTSSKFKSYVGCMKGKFKILFQVKDHFQHAHMQTIPCKNIQIY